MFAGCEQSERNTEVGDSLPQWSVVWTNTKRPVGSFARSGGVHDFAPTTVLLQLHLKKGACKALYFVLGRVGELTSRGHTMETITRYGAIAEVLASS